MAKDHEFDENFTPEEQGFDGGQSYDEGQDYNGGQNYAFDENQPYDGEGWTEYIPGEDGIHPVPPLRDYDYWDGDPYEGYEELPDPGRGFVYMSGEQLDNGGYLPPDELDRGDPQSARDFRPVRFRRDRKFGCLGGLMYAAFVISAAIILTCLGWMAANDVLALNKPDISATVELPKEIFADKEVDKKDKDGNVIGTTTVKAADIDEVAKILKDNGLIEYVFLFKLYAKVSHADEKVDPGTYTLTSDFDYRALITKMQAGSESQVRTKLTFPEGFTMRQIFKRLDNYDICSSDDLMKAAATVDFDFGFLEGIPLGNANRLEGFLFPDTYEFYQGMSASAAIRKFLNNFHNKLTREMLDQIEDLGITMKDAVTIASMIEKEAAVVDGEDDRNSVASVIYNRLKAEWYLGIDATILYSYPDWDGKTPTIAEMLDRDDPYNTRTRLGLTPTPICSPGLAALKAALSPAQTTYMFYALDTETGMHKFFTNERDFLAFVATQNYD